MVWITVRLLKEKHKWETALRSKTKVGSQAIFLVDQRRASKTTAGSEAILLLDQRRAWVSCQRLKLMMKQDRLQDGPASHFRLFRAGKRLVFGSIQEVLVQSETSQRKLSLQRHYALRQRRSSTLAWAPRECWHNSGWGFYSTSASCGNGRRCWRPVEACGGALREGVAKDSRLGRDTMHSWSKLDEREREMKGYGSTR